MTGGRLVAVVLLVATLAMLARFMRRDRVRYRAFAAAGDGVHRIVAFRRIAWRCGVMFGAVSLAMLAMIGRLGAVIAMPAEFVAVSPWEPVASDAELALFFASGILLGCGVAFARYRWRGPRMSRGRMLGDIAVLVPRTREELPWGALVSLSAGVCEELMFRLVLPLLVALATGRAIAGFVIATLLFGAMHRYQGKAGVVATTMVGAMLAAIYLATHALWLAIAFHVLIDMAALVAHPLQRGVWRISSSAASRS